MILVSVYEYGKRAGTLIAKALCSEWFPTDGFLSYGRIFINIFYLAGSSHFSTLAAMLVWAKHGGEDYANKVHFLDAEDIVTGKIPTALLHGE